MSGIREMMGLDKANFSTVEKDMSEITERFLTNEKIVKLLHYNSGDCLTNDELEITPEILSKVAKDNVRIVPSMKIPENKGSFLIITFDDFQFNYKNPEYMDNVILVDVLCPVDSWMMDTYMLRPFHLMHEVQRELNDRPLNGIGKVYFTYSKLLNLGDYVGYQMAFSVINDA